MSAGYCNIIQITSVGQVPAFSEAKHIFLLLYSAHERSALFFPQCLLLALFLTSTMPWICFCVQNKNKVGSGPSLSIPLSAIPCRGHIWAPLLHPGEPAGKPSRVALLATHPRASCRHPGTLPTPPMSFALCWKTQQN